MEKDLKNILDYFEDMIDNGDQGENHDCIVTLIKKNPSYLEKITTIFKEEKDEDRKEIWAGILTEFNVDVAMEFLKGKGLW